VDSRAGSAFGKYTITRLLGKGGMGEVYEAYDTAKGRTVALKILSDEFSNDATFRKRFQRESHAAAILQEPHVVPIHDWGEIDGRLYIDMRLVAGQTLSDLLRNGPLEPPRAVSIISQVGAALDAAHAEELIHRDIKPQNIIVTPADFAYLVDFGIAETTGQTRLTTAGMQIGTFHYMAPERFRDQAATLAVDIYSLACVLYESLTGQTPFSGDSVETILAAQLYLPPPRPSEVNPRVPVTFDEVIARGMAKEPDDRYTTAGALSRAAQRALYSSGATVAGALTAQGPAGPSPTAATASWPVDSDPTAHASTVSAVSGGSAPASSTEEGPTEVVVTAVPEGASGQSRRARMMMLVGAAALVVVACAGVGIALHLHHNSRQTPAPSSSTAAGNAEPASTQGASAQVSPQSQPSAPLPPPVTGPSAALPPLVTGPDETFKHRSCDEGFTLPTATGFGTHAGRGTPTTGCVLAENVLTSYWAEYGNASPLPRAVSAQGAADCRRTNASCDGSKFVMQCQQYAGDGWITCTGGVNGRVYLW
jgi:serine/threonine protein kinase